MTARPGGRSHRRWIPREGAGTPPSTHPTALGVTIRLCPSPPAALAHLTSCPPPPTSSEASKPRLVMAPAGQRNNPGLEGSQGRMQLGRGAGGASHGNAAASSSSSPSILPFLLEKEPRGEVLPQGQPRAWPSCSSGANISCRKTSRERQLVQPRRSRASCTGAQGQRVWGPCGLLPTLGEGWTPGCSPRCQPSLLCSILPAQTPLPPCSHPRSPASPAPALLPGSTLSFSVWNDVFQGRTEQFVTKP